MAKEILIWYPEVVGTGKEDRECGCLFSFHFLKFHASDRKWFARFGSPSSLWNPYRSLQHISQHWHPSLQPSISGNRCFPSGLKDSFSSLIRIYLRSGSVEAVEVRRCRRAYTKRQAPQLLRTRALHGASRSLSNRRTSAPMVQASVFSFLSL